MAPSIPEPGLVAEANLSPVNAAPRRLVGRDGMVWSLRGVDRAGGLYAPTTVASCPAWVLEPEAALLAAGATPEAMAPVAVSR